MANYVQLTNFADKDALPAGNAAKIIRGSEFQTEFQNIQEAVNSKADLASPTFTGLPAAPTASAGNNTTQVATTAFVSTAVVNERTATTTLTNKTLTSPTISGGTVSGITDLAVADGGTGASTAADARTNLGLVIGTDVSPISSPAFTDTPTAPTAADGTNTTQVATTAFVSTAITNERSATVTLTNKTLTDAVANTQSAGDNSTKVATTAYVNNAVQPASQTVLGVIKAYVSGSTLYLSTTP